MDTLEASLHTIMDPASMSKAMAHFEERPGQVQMAKEVATAFSNDSFALIEAGTGTGKSLAYLLPALLFASRTGEPVIVSTNTITLQEQLLNKDIPLALKLLGHTLNIVLAKGMGNYLCLKKLTQRTETHALKSKESKEEEQFLSWCMNTDSGERSDVPFPIKSELWDSCAADMETCSTGACSHASDCFLIAARKALQEAHLILTNHHLLCVDIVKRIETGNTNDMCLLPPLKRLILDEAHHIEDVATTFFSHRSAKADFLRALSAFGDSQMAKIRHLFSKKDGERVEDLIAKGKGAAIASNELFEAIDHWSKEVFSQGSSESDGIQKARITESLALHPLYEELKQNIVPKEYDRIMNFCSAWKRTPFSLSKSAKKQALKSELDLACARLEKAAWTVRLFFLAALDPTEVRWIERHHNGNTTLVRASFDLASTLQEHLFSCAKTAVLCSATLATGKNFNFLRSRLGLTTEDIKLSETIVSSPFDYEKNALFAVPVDVPPPDSATYMEQLPRWCAQLIRASGGGTLVLFTSYAAMQLAFEQTKALLRTTPFTFLKQGDHSRKYTLETFAQDRDAVLFATASYWEGVDIPGDSLRSVIIAKLPFDVPSDPLAEARAEALKQKGESPFAAYALPRACMRFKQAFGRLIRRKGDRGVVICLDTRLLTKSYGSVFLKTLPPCPIVKTTIDEITKQVGQFFLSRVE